MFRAKTHFEQVPLEIVKKIAEEEIQRKETTEQTQRPKQKSGKAAIKGEA
jgi:hypothetical protein